MSCMLYVCLVCSIIARLHEFEVIKEVFERNHLLMFILHILLNTKRKKIIIMIVFA